MSNKLIKFGVINCMVLSSFYFSCLFEFMLELQGLNIIIKAIKNLVKLWAGHSICHDTILEKVVDRLKVWKDNLEAKGLRVNLLKTKVMVSGPELQTLKDSSQYPCAICRNGVSCNAIQCNLCTLWIHKKCSGKLKADPNYQCKRCLRQERPLDGALVVR